MCCKVGNRAPFASVSMKHSKMVKTPHAGETTAENAPGSSLPPPHTPISHPLYFCFSASLLPPRHLIFCRWQINQALSCWGDSPTSSHCPWKHLHEGKTLLSLQPGSPGPLQAKIYGFTERLNLYGSTASFFSCEDQSTCRKLIFHPSGQWHSESDTG